MTDAQFKDSEVYHVVLTAVLLSDSCYAANSNLAESSNDFRDSVRLVYELEKVGLAKVLTTTDSKEEFVEARRRLYQKVPERYPMYFNAKEWIFPTRPLVLRNSTTEELQSNILSSLRKSVPAPLASKADDIKKAIKNRDENAITVGILQKMTPLKPIESHHLGQLITENYHKRYLDAMNGCLIKGLPYISFFDRFSSERFYYNLYAPVLTQAYIRFIMQEQDLAKQVQMIVAIKENQYHKYFIDLLYSLASTLLEQYGIEKEGDVAKLLRTEVGSAMSRLPHCDPQRALENLSSSIELLRYKYHFDLNETMEQNIKKILYIVATDTEFSKVISFYKEKGVSLRHIEFSENIYWDLGMVGKSHVYLTKSGMGAKRPDGAILTISQAATELSPDYMIMIGIAFGMKEDRDHPDNPQAQKIGDILVSTEIEDYGTCKIMEGGIIERGSKIPADPALIKRFTQAVALWEGAKVRSGLIITNDKLVNKQEFVDGLRERFKDAIGGEMEGCGFLANYKNPWILVKAICDFGHDKGDEYQGDAAMNAIQYVDFVVREFSF